MNLLQFEDLIIRLLNYLKSKKHTFLIVLPVLIGVLSGVGSFVFRNAIEFVHHYVFIGGSALLSIGESGLSRLSLPLILIAGALLLIPIYYFFPSAMGYRLPYFLEKINMRGGYLRRREIVSTLLASAITIGTGGSSGQEGPIAKIGGIIGSGFAKQFKLTAAQTKSLIACGVAGAIGATFNAPIAGVFFSLEVILLNTFELGSFTPIVISSGVGTIVMRMLMGSKPGFVVVPVYFVQSHLEYLFYVILGLLVGVFAVFFIKVFYKITDIFESWKINKLFKPVIGMALVGIIGIKYPQILSDGQVQMEKILNNELVGPALIVIFFLKILATSLTMGSGGAGGVFAPSMFLGAALGGSFGGVVNRFFPSYTAPAGLYALVGMGGFLAAATHAPMTAIFLLFELTGKYEVIIPIMFTCVVGTSLARWINKETIDTYDLARKGINLHSGKEISLLKSIKVKDSMTEKPETVPESMTLKKLLEYFPKSKHISFPIVDSDKLLTGIISVQDFRGLAYERELQDLIIAKDIATLDVLTVTEEDDLHDAMHKIGHRNIEQLPVVSKDNPRKIVGILSIRDIISSYNSAIEKRLLLEHKKEMFVD